ncbi:acyltransferase family protein [Candidatus Lokiarchaeum ossiferum]|uniref:acyltransferase family protein n=1 Tax=Candidatus Lokiarchaeum ossiferum TaxID=2951803 RepID=UPI00352C56AF
MKNTKFIELDILRIISCLIVVVLIHIPNNYGYTFYMDFSTYTGYLFHTLGINNSMSAFVFISGFSLFLSKNNRNLNSRTKIGQFLKKRFLRIFPLYWIALIIYFIIFPFFETSFIYGVAHVFGLQIFFAPLGGDPIWTIWFIGIIVLYYLIFIVLSYLDSLKKIIPAAIIIDAIFVALNLLFGIVEYRFFQYYNFFILGIIIAKFYTSNEFENLKEKLLSKNKNGFIFLALIIALVCLPVYFLTSNLVYTYLNAQHGTPHIVFLVMQQAGSFEIAIAVILMNLIAVLFIASSISILYLVKRLLFKIFKEKSVQKIFSTVGYATFGVYLFHRPLLIIFSEIITRIFNINLFTKANLWIVLMFVPFIFLVSFFVQRIVDWGVAWCVAFPTRKKTDMTIEADPIAS